MDYYQRCEWVFQQRGISSTQKFVLLVLAKRASNELREGYPSIPSICDDTGLDKKTVIKALKELCDQGFITDTGRRSGLTKQVVVYKINGLSQMEQKNDTKNGTVPKTEQFHFSSETDPNFPGNSSVFPQKQTQKRVTELKKELKKNIKGTLCASTGFSEFYSAYPNKKNRKKAEAAWKKINPDETLQAEIMAGLERAKQSRDWQKDGGQYIPHPTTWLNGSRWEDEIEPEPLKEFKQKHKEPFLGIRGLI
jgi:DNA-binding transcriptional MocR family regulator